MELTWSQWVVGLLVATIWHELGHLVAARSVHMPVRRIYVGLGPMLWRRPLHGATELVLRGLPVGMSIAVEGRYDAGGRLRRPVWHDAWVAAAGPLASLLLSLLLVVAVAGFPVSPEVRDAAIGFATLSTLLALLNLAPIPGLDGGHLLLLALDRWLPRRSPTQEAQLQRRGVQVVVLLSLLPVVYMAIQHVAGVG